MQSMTRSMSLNFASKRRGGNSNSHQQPTEDLEAFESGETVALKNFCWFVRSYGTCGNMTPYVPSPSSHQNRYRKCLTHIVNEHETLAGIALRYDLTVEDLRRTNSFLWTTSSVYVGQTLKIPIIDGTAKDLKTETEHQMSVPKRKSSEASAVVQIGPSASEFWTKVDDSIEASKKVTNEFKKKQLSPHKKDPKDLLKC